MSSLPFGQDAAFVGLDVADPVEAGRPVGHAA
jgi:hypothetical protein